MNRVLIAAADPVTAVGVQSALATNGFQTAVVTDYAQLIDFCRQHTPDLTVIDLALPGGSVWSAVQAMRCDSRLAAMPIIGVGAGVSDQERQQGLRIGIVAIEAKPVSPPHLVSAVRHAIQSSIPATNITQMPSQSAAPANGRDPVNVLLSQAREIRSLTAELKPHVAAFGEEAPELFTYIENSGKQIEDELTRIAAEGPESSAIALQDKDVRHDFRNMIGSVTGFSELLLMEPTVEGQNRARFVRIREICRAFCDLLDEQKAAAAA
jgi:CheY-like chemotaxis protein